jgi:hypothetical protein
MLLLNIRVGECVIIQTTEGEVVLTLCYSGVRWSKSPRSETIKIGGKNCGDLVDNLSTTYLGGVDGNGRLADCLRHKLTVMNFPTSPVTCGSSAVLGPSIEAGWSRNGPVWPSDNKTPEVFGFPSNLCVTGAQPWSLDYSGWSIQAGDPLLGMSTRRGNSRM